MRLAQLVALAAWLTVAVAVSSSPPASSSSSSPTSNEHPILVGNGVSVVTTRRGLDALRPPPGISYLGQGYNLISGNPLGGEGDDNVDPGFRAPAIQLEFEQSRRCAEDRYLCPKGAWLREENLCNHPHTSQKIDDLREYQAALAHDARLNSRGSLRVATGMFRASHGAKEYTSTLRKEGEVLFKTQAVCVQYHATLESRKYSRTPAKLSPEFAGAVESLPEEYTTANQAEFDEFISEFGTHYVRSMDVGSKKVLLLALAKSTVAEFEAEDKLREMEAALALATQVGHGNSTRLMPERLQIWHTLEPHVRVVKEIVAGAFTTGEWDHLPSMRSDRPVATQYRLEPLHLLISDKKKAAALAEAVDAYALRFYRRDDVLGGHEYYNLALYKPCTSSSMEKNYDPVRAVDGILTDKIAGGGVFQSDAEDEPWWRVDLEEMSIIRNIEIFLSESNPPGHFMVEIVDDKRHIVVKKLFEATEGGKIKWDLKVAVTGFSVRIVQSKSDKPRSLTIVEVRVFGKFPGRGQPVNVAPLGIAITSSMFKNFLPQLAVDRNPNPRFSGRSIAATQFELHPFWQLDLRTAYRVDKVLIWQGEHNDKSPSFIEEGKHPYLFPEVRVTLISPNKELIASHTVSPPLVVHPNFIHQLVLDWNVMSTKPVRWVKIKATATIPQQMFLAECMVFGDIFGRNSTYDHDNHNYDIAHLTGDGV